MADKLIIKDVQQAEGVLAEMSAVERKLLLIEGAMNEEIDNAKARAQQEGASLIVRYNELEKAVKAFGTLNKSRLFSEKRSLELAFGTISFRQSTRITLQRRVTEEMALQALRNSDCPRASASRRNWIGRRWRTGRTRSWRRSA